MPRRWSRAGREGRARRRAGVAPRCPAPGLRDLMIVASTEVNTDEDRAAWRRRSKRCWSEPPGPSHAADSRQRQADGGGRRSDARARERPDDLHGQPGAAHRGGADLRDRPRSTCTGVDLDEPAAFTPRLGGLSARRHRPAGPGRAGSGAPLRAPVAHELRHRHRAVPARLVHHEAQPAPQREDGAAAGLRRHPSAAAAIDRAGRAGRDRRAGALAVRADRHAGGRADAEGRRARRDVRHDGDQGGARGARRGRTRTVVLVPESAHGTNPATAALLGYRVEVDPGAGRTARSIRKR